MPETEVICVNEHDVRVPDEEAEAWFANNAAMKACVNKFVSTAKDPIFKDPLWNDPEIPLELQRQRAALLRRAMAVGETFCRLFAREARKALGERELERLAPELERLEQGRHTKADAARLVKALPQSGRGYYRYERQAGRDWQLMGAR